MIPDTVRVQETLFSILYEIPVRFAAMAVRKADIRGYGHDTKKKFTTPLYTLLAAGP